MEQQIAALSIVITAALSNVPHARNMNLLKPYEYIYVYMYIKKYVYIYI